MSRYTVNYICTDQYGHEKVRSEEYLTNKVEEAIAIVKSKWVNFQLKIIWAGFRRTDGGL